MSEYKTYGRSEDLLETYLPAYDNKLVQSMIQEARAQIDQIGRFMLKTEPESFTIKGMHQEAAYWEISFTLPVIQYVPQCFRFITKNPPYYWSKGQFLECVPSYMPNINHLTLLNSYNYNNPEFSDNRDGIIRKYVFDGGKTMQMSSLNNLLKGHHQPKHLQDAHHVVRMSFEMCYWNPPNPPSSPRDSCINNLIYHSHGKVHNVLMTRKTLVKVLKIDDRKTKRDIFHDPRLKSRIAGNLIDVKDAEVLVLCDDGNNITSHKESMWLTEDVADSLNDGDIFNAMIVMGRMRNSKIAKPFVIGKIGSTVKPGDVKCILALVLWKMLQTLEDDSSPTLVGSMNQVNAKLTEIILKNYEMFSYENFTPEMMGWTKDLPKKISKCIEEMFPMYQADGENIYQLSPTIMSFLACMQPEILQDRDKVLLIMKLFDKAYTNRKDWGDGAMMQLRTTQHYSDLQKSTSDTNQILKVSQRLVNRIVYARILSQHWA